jgi:hypothetical protein
MEHETNREYNKEFRFKHNHHNLPDLNIVAGHARHLVEELDWLQRILEKRLSQLQSKEIIQASFHEMPPPDFGDEVSPYSTLIKETKLGHADRLLLACSLAPHLAPELFTSRLKKPDSLDIQFPQLGGYIDGTFHTFVPTFQTALHLLAGNDQTNTMFFQIALMDAGSLIKDQIVNLTTVKTAETDGSFRQMALELAQEYLYYFISGKKPLPDFGKGFPASLINTNLDWEQLVVSENTIDELKRIMRWSQSGKELVQFTNKTINPGFSCLFYGPPGTGKTLAAKLIGKSLDREVFRIDLSMIVSKYIGETEKNLAYLFDRAEGKDWILFFDEADSLFGKRTNISDSKDKWANLEMSYLLQRMEEYEGITILATNLKNNLDSALNRRFQSIVYFGRPNIEQRKEQWTRLLPEGFVYDRIDMNKLAIHNLTGGNIANILKAACLEAFHKGEYAIKSEYLVEGIKREFAKEGRSAY